MSKLQVTRTKPEDAAAGYVVVDAMVALMIIALATILSFRAIEGALQATTSAWEVRRAQALIGRLLDTAPRTYRPHEGATDGFSWRLETQLTGADRPIEICRRSVRLINLRTDRRYDAATLETCPLEEPI